MRIDRLDLIAYGAFTDTSLDLSEGAAGLHLIYGDNEAGKSTSLRALTAWLFGIAPRTSDNFLHSHPQLRIGGRLRHSDGRELEFVRRKGTKDTLLAPGSDEPLSESLLRQFMPGGMNEALFTRLYGINHTGMIAGGRELLAQSGDLGQALFSAAIGTAGLRGVISDLKNGADELFKPRASTKRVNRGIAQFKEAQKRIREATLSVSDWEKLQSDFSDTLAAIERVESSITEKSRVKSRLDRLARVRGALAERRAVLLKIEELGEVLLLPEDFDENLRNALGRLKSATEAEGRFGAKLARLSEECETLKVRSELLENDDAIQAVYKELGAVEKTIEDRPKRDGERRMLRMEAARLLKSIRPDIAVDEAERLGLLLSNKKWISDLRRQHSLLLQRKEDAESSFRDAEAEHKETEEKLGEAPRSDTDLEGLKAAVAEARKAGELEQRLSDSGKRAREAKAACDDGFAGLGRFSGKSSLLLRVAFPVPETLDAFEKRYDDISGRIRDSARRERELREERNTALRDLKTLMKQGGIPAVADLEEKRALRDAGWQLIKRKYIENGKVEGEIRKLAGDAELPYFYEQSVTDADLVSDLLRSNADLVAKRAELEARLETLSERICETETVIEQCAEEERACKDEWASVWSPLNIDPGTPREMKQWILRAAKLAEDIRDADSEADDAERLTKECERLKAALASHIARFENSPDLSSMGLDAMIQLCEERVEWEEASIDRISLLENRLGESGSRLRKMREELDEIENTLSAWKREWNKAVGELVPGTEMHPEQAAEAFERLEEFFEKKDRSGELDSRIAGMDRAIGEFRQRVFQLADRIGFDHEDMAAEVVAAQMSRDLTEAREIRASLGRIETQKKELAQEMEDAGITARSAREQLEALRETAGVSGDGELEKAGRRSGTARELRKRLDILEQELTRNGDGLSVEALEAEAAESDIDSLEDDLGRIASELQELQKERDSLRDRRQTLRNEIHAKDGSAAAAAALEESEQQLADIVTGVEQYLRLQIASMILEQHIERYRRKNQAPVLARAGELFSRLTLESYANLRDELDDGGKPVLFGLRPDDREVPVEGMSDGARDQLYLSLRLAVLEQHLEKGEPMPFIVDDILVGFDDNRTAVCLEVLSELAAKTQVLLFTHHRRVFELAEKLEAAPGVFTHELARHKEGDGPVFPG